MTRYFHYCLTVTVFILWIALSEERTGLSFVYAAGRCQSSLSRVRFPWDSRPYFTLSDLRLLFPSPPKTRRVTVEVFDPASTRESASQYFFTELLSLSLSLTLRPTFSRPVCLGIKHSSGLTIRFLLPYGIRNTSETCGFVDMGRSL
jgi:hypothetical protein